MEWIMEKVNGLISYLESSASQAIGGKILELAPIFVVITLVGIYISMSGNKKLGTKLSSGSVIIYLLLKVFFHA